MKKLGFVTTNKVLAQSLAAAVKSNAALGLEPFLLLNPQQAPLDAEVLKLDIAIVDVMDTMVEEPEAVLCLCERLREALPHCRLLLLVSQDDKAGKKMAVNAVKRKAADDFVFYDTSLEYLFAKLTAF